MKPSERLGLELLVHINQDGLAQGIGPFTHGSAVHTDVMKTQALQAGAGQVRVRRGLRRRPARRGKIPRQGTDLLLPLGPASLGPEAPASGAMAGLQRTQAQGREPARVSAVELDGAGHLAVHPPAEDSHRAAVFRGQAAGGGARRHADHGGRRAHAAAARREAADAQRALPHTGLLSADWRSRKRGRTRCRK